MSVPGASGHLGSGHSKANLRPAALSIVDPREPKRFHDSSVLQRADRSSPAAMEPLLGGTVIHAELGSARHGQLTGQAAWTGTVFTAT